MSKDVLADAKELYKRTLAFEGKEKVGSDPVTKTARPVARRPFPEAQFSAGIDGAPELASFITSSREKFLLSKKRDWHESSALDEQTKRVVLSAAADRKNPGRLTLRDVDGDGLRASPFGAESRSALHG